jgi:ribonuclease E
MPFGGNFHPEWGALAPVPSFMRTARIVAVATAIGATAGAAVVLSLAGSSAAFGPQANSDAASDKPLVIVHSLVQPAEAAPVAAQLAPSPVAVATPVNVPAAMPAPAASASAAVQPTGNASTVSLAGTQPSKPVPSDSHSASTSAAPASVAALAEIPPATEASPAPAPDQATFMPDQTEAQKLGGKKPRSTDPTQQPRPQTAAANGQNPPKRKPEEHGLGPLLRHLFSARAGSIFPN